MRRLACALILGAFSVFFIAGPAFAAPGNNGTVKIDGVEFDTHPDNEPHVGCDFQVDFYGYDEGDLQATATFALHPPTGTDVLLTQTADIGEDPAGGGTDLDAEMNVNLLASITASGATPQPNQGYHVKLTVHAEGSIGADVKHKVFWVDCGVYPPVPLDANQVGGLSTGVPSNDSNAAAVVGWALGAFAILLLSAGLVRRVATRTVDRRS